MTNLGRTYLEKHDTIASENLLKNALEISQKAGYNQGIAESAEELGILFQSRDSLPMAIRYYSLSLDRIKNMDYDDIFQEDYKGMFSCYQALKQYKIALYYHCLLLETEKRLLSVENTRQMAIIQFSYNLEKKEKDNQVLRKDIELKEMTIKRKSAVMLFILALLISSI